MDLTSLKMWLAWLKLSCILVQSHVIGGKSFQKLTSRECSDLVGPTKLTRRRLVHNIKYILKNSEDGGMNVDNNVRSTPVGGLFSWPHSLICCHEDFSGSDRQLFRHRKPPGLAVCYMFFLFIFSLLTLCQHLLQCTVYVYVVANGQYCTSPSHINIKRKNNVSIWNIF